MTREKRPIRVEAKSVDTLSGMRILFATPHLFPDVIGGSGLHSVHLIRHLAGAGHELDVLHPYPTRHFPDLPAVTEHTLPKGRHVLDFARHVDRWTGSRTWDVGYSDGLPLVRYLRRRRFPCIVNDHTWREFQPQYFRGFLRHEPRKALIDLALFRPRLWARRHLARNSDYAVSMGGLLDENLFHQCDLTPERILNLPNAVDVRAPELDADPAPAGDPHLLLYVGALTYRKGIHILMEAMRRLPDLNVRVRLVGDGPMADTVWNANLGNVELAGPRFGADLAREYRQAGAFVYPSLHEGMPTALLEAMWHRLPLVATDVGANRLLATRQTGQLIPPNDAAALEGAIRHLDAQTAANGRAQGQAGRDRVQDRYRWDVVGPMYEEAFRAAAAGSASPW